MEHIHRAAYKTIEVLVNACEIARIQMRADMATRIQQPVEKECNLKIIEVLGDAIDRGKRIAKINRGGK